jgi:hypothetical protein
MQARHHNALKDETIAIATDLRNVFKQDLDDTQALSTTAATLKMRIDQLSRALRDIKGGATTTADWKDTPRESITKLYTGRILAMTQTAYRSLGLRNSGTSFISTGLSCTTAIVTSTSKFEISWSETFGIAGVAGSVEMRLMCGASEIHRATVHYHNDLTGSALTMDRSAATVFYSPATTGSITFSTEFRATNAGVSILANGDGTLTDTSFLIVKEISQ